MDNCLNGLKDKITPEYVQILLERIASNSFWVGQCLIWQKSVHSGGYPQIKVTVRGWGGRPVLTHRLLYVLKTKQYDLGIDHVSHVCHHCLCVNFDHLSLEPAPVNMQRQFCKMTKVCSGHGDYSHCIL